MRPGSTSLRGWMGAVGFLAAGLLHASWARAPLARDAAREPAVELGAPALAQTALAQTALAQTAPAPPAAPASGELVVARVGASVVTAGELERRIAETPRRQLAALGATPEEIRRAFLDRVLVRELLLAEEAKARKLDAEKDVRDRRLGVLRSVLLDDLRKQEKLAEISQDEVKAYYQANAEKFISPKRIGIARILVGSEKEATELIAELGATPDPKKWNDLARDRSLDKATHLRGGTLGLVAEDGSTSRGETHVDPGLFAAADAVEDGALVLEPVKEGARFAVVWKRQTMRPVERPIEVEAPTIRGILAEQKMRGAVTSLLEKLRAELVKESNPELCDMLAISAAGDVEKAKRPGVLPRTKRGAQAVPTAGPGGLR